MGRLPRLAATLLAIAALWAPAACDTRFVVPVGEAPGVTRPAVARERARVVRVVDGDTIIVDRGAGPERLRYIGIDAPESVTPDVPVEAFGSAASEANERLVAGREVILERDVSERDRFDRLLRYVWVETTEGDLMVNEELARLGLAEVRTYAPDTRHQARLRAAEDDARAAGRGIHADG